MDNNINFDYIWTVYQKEKQTNKLTLVQKQFYSDIEEFVKNADKSTLEGQAAISNAIQTVNLIVAARKKKIIIYAAYSKPLPQPIPEEERNFYNDLLNVIKNYGIKNSDDKLEDGTRKMLKVLISVPEITLPSGNRIGPLEKDQLVEIEDEDDRKYLENNKVCARP